MVAVGVGWKHLTLVVAVVFLVAVAPSEGSATTGRHAAHRTQTYSTHGTRPLRTALFDPYSFVGANNNAYAMAAEAGSSFARLIVHWSSIAPATRPVGFVPSDPASPGYSWATVDRMVAAAENNGVTPIVDVVKPPRWAYARHPRGSHAGTPKITALRTFARALATHYDGNHGAPRVHIFQVWNEPNLSLDLFPVKAGTYRKMVNAFTASVHAVDWRNLVVAGGLDPFGNKTKRFHSVSPLKFMRALLCVSMGNPKAKKAKLRHPHRTCKARIHFDVWSHHPYTFGGPFGHARVADDVSLGDLPKMRKLLRAGVKLHRVVSDHPVQFWVTEFSWDTQPPRRHAAPIRLATRWTSESLYQMWRSGVSLVTWFLLQDRPKPSPYESGLFFYSKQLSHARAKPTRQAFRFPFVAYLDGNKVRVWGRDATSDKRLVTIQRRHGGRGRWKVVARIRTNRTGIFKADLRLSATKKDWLRATAFESGKALPFSLNPPKHKRYGPWGN